MARKTPAPSTTRQLAARVPVAVYHRLEAIRTALSLTQAQAIEAGIDALEKKLTAEQRRTFQFFLEKR